MADATKSDLLTRLNIKARDGSDVTFTTQEKNDALTTAINDPYVTRITRDTSITTTTTGDSYPVPQDNMTVLKVGIQLNTYGKPSDIDSYSVYDDTIYLDDLPPSGKTLVVIGSLKLTEFDAIPDNRQEYVLTLAKLELCKLLQQSLANQFLTNDMSMAELISLEQNLGREAQAWRTKFATEIVEL